MNTIDDMQRFPVVITEEIRKVLELSEITIRKRVIRPHQTNCSDSPQPPPEKRAKVENEIFGRVNNVNKTIVESKNGVCYGFIMRHVSLDLHEDSFLMIRLVKLENAKVDLEISRGTFNRKKLFQISKTVSFNNEEEGISYYESEECTKLIDNFHSYSDPKRLSIVKLSETEKKSMADPEIVLKLKEHGVVSDIGIEGYAIDLNVENLEYCENILDELMSSSTDAYINKKASIVGLSNSFYATIPQFRDNGDVQPVLEDMNLILEKKQLINALIKIKRVSTI